MLSMLQSSWPTSQFGPLSIAATVGTEVTLEDLNRAVVTGVTHKNPTGLLNLPKDPTLGD